MAVLPFDIPEQVNAQDAEVLAQMLATDIANSGKYAVFPRTRTIEQVMKEQNIQRSGITDPDSIKEIGRATSPVRAGRQYDASGFAQYVCCPNPEYRNRWSGNRRPRELHGHRRRLEAHGGTAVLHQKRRGAVMRLSIA
jgi:hypothetical protein